MPTDVPPRPLTFAELLERPLMWARYWLMGSYLYYIKDSGGLMSDSEYDFLAKRMQETTEWKKGVDSYLIDDGMLTAGSAFNLREENYPRRLIAAAMTVGRILNLGV